MATVRTLENGFQLTDWTDEINNIDHRYSFFTGMNMFNGKGVASTSISFDKSLNDTTLLPDNSRRERDASKGKDRQVETFVLPLGYFKHEDSITPEDIQNVKAAGSANEPTTWAKVRVDKLEDMQHRVMQTHEYMMLNAAKGICKTPQGTVLANMFTEFGVSQETVDFELDDDTTNVSAKISLLKSKVQSNLKTGSLAGDLRIVVSRSFFDALTDHPKVRAAYLNYINTNQAGGSQVYRDDLSKYFDWGITDSFRHAGVEFVTYEATFKLPDGSTEVAVAAGEGFVVLPRARDMYRAYYGPANKISGANQAGRKMFAYEYPDPRDEFYDMEVETSPLFIATQPKAIIKVIAQ